jgi:hypothetical protein
LGDYNAKILVRTHYLNGKHFALRGGQVQEHRRLRYRPAQITVDEAESGNRAYLKYNEDVSKINQAGLKHHKLNPKTATHYANLVCPEISHVRIYKEYVDMSPKCASIRNIWICRQSAHL